MPAETTIRGGPPRSLAAVIVSRHAAPYWALFAISLAIRLAHYSIMSRTDPFFGALLPGADNHTLDRWALEIAQTFWLGYDRIPFFHGPLYPYVLAMIYLRFGHHYEAAVLCQHLMGALTAVLVFHLGRRIFNRPTGWIAGLLTATCPLFLIFEGEILADSLILLTNAAMLCALVAARNRDRPAWWAFAGFLLGLTILGRPNNLLFVPFVVLWCASTSKPRRRFPHAALLTAVVLVTILPATLANTFIGNRFALVTYTGPVNAYIGNAPDSLGVFAIPHSMYAIREQEGMSDKAIDWSAHLRNAIRQAPASLPRNLWKKTCLFWQSGEIPHNVSFYIKRTFSPFLRLPIVFGVIAPLGLLGVAAALSRSECRRLSGPVALLLAYVTCYSASIIMVFVLARLRLPVLAILMVFAAYALHELTMGIAAALRASVSRPCGGWRCWKRPLFIAAAWLALGLALRSPPNAPLIRWNDYYNLAGAYERRDDDEAALREYNRAIHLAPPSPVLRALRDAVAERLGQASQARAQPPAPQPETQSPSPEMDGGRGET